MIKLTICLLISLFFFLSCQQNKEITFEPFYVVNFYDSIEIENKKYLKKRIAYLIENYQETLESEMKIDSFVCLNIDPLKKYLDYYSILIYKKSKITNNDHIKADPKDIDRYSQENDLLYIYDWSDGDFASKMKYNGKAFIDSLMCK